MMKIELVSKTPQSIPATSFEQLLENVTAIAANVEQFLHDATKLASPQVGLLCQRID